jgi:hypothetical protein
MDMQNLQPLVLENAALRAEFGRTNGALIALAAQHSRWRVIGRPQLGLSFGRVVPLPDRLNHRVPGETQPLSSYDHDRGGRRLTLRWRTLSGETGVPLDIDFTGVVELTDCGLEWTGYVVNRSAHRATGSRAVTSAITTRATRSWCSFCSS